ncbi:hypothetical protein [Aquabacterium sp. OR-4]|uniref:hypothetical protein n=1 Tax=Aquabacterium sp. OR-4 TaxID=2978127 RepID=UPI0021B29624|nr:hypothetical protein [Aquabacterium sp. OR-4]MDT7837202.1 hypothetical protein [Aquabacterium sp. OR-4]
MRKHLLAALAAACLAVPAQASVLDTQTHPVAAAVAPYGVFHDGVTHFVFLRLPEGWRFVGRDADAQSHEVFLDAGTGFVFVKLSTGWKFVGRTN